MWKELIFFRKETRGKVKPRQAPDRVQSTVVARRKWRAVWHWINSLDWIQCIVIISVTEIKISSSRTCTFSGKEFQRYTFVSMCHNKAAPVNHRVYFYFFWKLCYFYWKIGLVYSILWDNDGAWWFFVRVNFPAISCHPSFSRKFVRVRVSRARGLWDLVIFDQVLHQIEVLSLCTSRWRNGGCLRVLSLFGTCFTT